MLNSEPPAQGPLYLVASPFCGHQCPSLLWPTVRAIYFWPLLWEQGCGCGPFSSPSEGLLWELPLILSWPQGPRASRTKRRRGGAASARALDKLPVLPFPRTRAHSSDFPYKHEVCFKVTCRPHVWTQRRLALHRPATPATPRPNPHPIQQ